MAEPAVGSGVSGVVHRLTCVKIRDGQVVNRPIYVALAVTVDGTRDILGLWAGEHGDGEGAKYWLRVLTAIKNRGTKDCLIVVCDGLTGLPDAVAAVWPQTIVQTRVVHLLRNSFKYASRRDWAAIARDLKPIYTAPSEAAALDRFAEFSDVWETKYPAIVRLWTNAWSEFVPFLQFDTHIRTVISTTNAIESVNARIRRAVNARGHFPNEQAAMKCVYLAVMSLDPTGKGRQRWSNRWKAALNAFEITFDGRLSAGRNKQPKIRLHHYLDRPPTAHPTRVRHKPQVKPRVATPDTPEKATNSPQPQPAIYLAADMTERNERSHASRHQARRPAATDPTTPCSPSSTHSDRTAGLCRSDQPCALARQGDPRRGRHNPGVG